jgi:hypothetical protein
MKPIVGCMLALLAGLIFIAPILWILIRFLQ